MSKEIDNGGTCPFCFNKVHPQAIACNGCGASYQQEPSRADYLLAILCFLFGFGGIVLIAVTCGATFGVAYGVFLFIVLFIALRRGIRFLESRIKYVWVRRRQ